MKDMDLTNLNNLVGNSNPIQMPVSELLTGNYHFSIPSYQRGYRWESSIGSTDREVRQVDDLLNDLTHFVTANANKKANYYLQPLMVKPRRDNPGIIIWDVLDGQQRLTTMLLLLKCLNEKLCSSSFNLYTIDYANRPDIDFGNITFDKSNVNYNYPQPDANLDSFFVRKAKDRIEDWYATNVNTQQVRDKFKEALFYEDNSRVPTSTPNLRVLFIWYNVEPLNLVSSPLNINHDIAVFNRLNSGKISLTNSELLKALFLLCVKVNKNSTIATKCLVDDETLVRKWDEMERKFQDNEFWRMISPKNRVYENRLDYLFDFIRESDINASTTNSYRYFYNDMRSMLTHPDSRKLDDKWDEIKRFYDILCKWHENTTLHNYIGYLIEFGKTAAWIQKEINKNLINKGESAISTVKGLIKNHVATNQIDVKTLSYSGNESAIRKILVLFNVEVSEKHGERFSFDQYRERKYDIEHVNSQTDYAIVKPQERLDWIEDQALASLCEDRDAMDKTHPDYSTVDNLIKSGETLVNQGASMSQKSFDIYRADVEGYYAHGNKPSVYDKNWIGNLTLLNSTINREYKNALFPQKLRTIIRSDQEGEFIPLCTRYLFLKYYTDTKRSTSAFNMMRWRDEDQEGYYNAIINTLKEFLS